MSAFSSLMGEGDLKTDVLPSIVMTSVCIDTDMTELLDLFEPGLMTHSAYKSSHFDGVGLTDKFLSMALVHLYKVATIEVKKFNTKDWISKVAVERDGIYLQRTVFMRASASYLQVSFLL